MSDEHGNTSEAPAKGQATHHVVVNDEEQYSIWFADRTPPDGWRVVGQAGTEEECLEFIERTWTDMRPRSVRERMSTPAQT